MRQRWGGGIDGLLVSTKHLTSGGQTSDQEAAVQRTFHLERSSLFYLLCSNGKNSMYRFLACILHTIAPNAHPDSCLPGVKPHPMKINIMLYVGERICLNIVYMGGKVSTTFRCSTTMFWHKGNNLARHCLFCCFVVCLLVVFCLLVCLFVCLFWCSELYM